MPRRWGTDANIYLAPGSAFGTVGSVHLGMAVAANSVYSEIRQSVLRDGADRRVLITGHSLGGGLATLVADRLAKDGIEVHSLSSFANPAVGDTEFAESFREHTFNKCRTINDRDPVPFCPWLSQILFPFDPFILNMIDSYQHVDGTLIYFDASINAIVNPIRGEIRVPTLFWNIFQHATDLYLLNTYLNLSQETRDEVPPPQFED